MDPSNFLNDHFVLYEGDEKKRKGGGGVRRSEWKGKGIKEKRIENYKRKDVRIVIWEVLSSKIPSSSWALCTGRFLEVIKPITFLGSGPSLVVQFFLFLPTKSCPII